MGLFEAAHKETQSLLKEAHNDTSGAHTSGAHTETSGPLGGST